MSVTKEYFSYWGIITWKYTWKCVTGWLLFEVFYFAFFSMLHSVVSASLSLMITDEMRSGFKCWWTKRFITYNTRQYYLHWPQFYHRSLSTLKENVILFQKYWCIYVSWSKCFKLCDHSCFVLITCGGQKWFEFKYFRLVLFIVRLSFLANVRCWKPKYLGMI